MKMLIESLPLSGNQEMQEHHEGMQERKTTKPLVTSIGKVFGTNTLPQCLLLEDKDIKYHR